MFIVWFILNHFMLRATWQVCGLEYVLGLVAATSSSWCSKADKNHVYMVIWSWSGGRRWELFRGKRRGDEQQGIRRPGVNRKHYLMDLYDERNVMEQACELAGVDIYGRRPKTRVQNKGFQNRHSARRSLRFCRWKVQSKVSYGLNFFHHFIHYGMQMRGDPVTITDDTKHTQRKMIDRISVSRKIKKKKQICIGTLLCLWASCWKN